MAVSLLVILCDVSINALDRKIKSIEHLYLHSLPIKESEIVDFFLKAFVIVNIV